MQANVNFYSFELLCFIIIRNVVLAYLTSFSYF